uniref:ZSWIM4-8 C-terminal domain-containing protein n=1 Tax=Timema poppense TaxID=170557 RepID=A0A7R9D3W4_TIMPO|nr:unnamed protein product [Timema poppensis]
MIVSLLAGTQYLHQFCICAVNSIVSPFILHDVAIESAHYLSRNNPGLVMQHLRSALLPLVQKCQQILPVPMPLVDPSDAVGDNVSVLVYTGVNCRGSQTRLGARHNKSL